MQCQNWFEPGQEMGEGEMTQLVPVRWLVLAGAGWAVRLQITDSRSGAGDGDAAPLPGDWGLGTGVIMLVLWTPRDTSHYTLSC